jgi:hypothetical protein
MSGEIAVAVEGALDEIVLSTVFRATGRAFRAVYGKSGKVALDARLPAYDAAARHQQWLVLRDLDQDAACAPELVARLLPSRSPMMRLHIAVRAIEAWLLADRKTMSTVLGVPVARVPEQPESIDNPKSLIVQLARGSSSRRIRDALVPRDGSSAKVGPGYIQVFGEFAVSGWDPDSAAQRSDSLARLLRHLRGS